MHALLRYYYLTAAQVCRLYYSKGSLTTVQTRLKGLGGKGLVKVRFYRPRYPARATYTYHLTRKGLNHLADLGADTPRAFQPLRREAPTDPFLGHTLDVNDVLIALELLVRRNPAVQIRTVLHEHELKQRGTRILVQATGELQATTVPVIPDAFMDLAIRRGEKRYQECFAWEVDRGTMEQKRWKQKARAIITWSGAPFEATFGALPLTVAVLATPGQARHSNLLRWTEEVIRELPAAQQREASDLFRFSWGSAAERSPEEFYFASRWHTPHERGARPLLAGNEL